MTKINTKHLVVLVAIIGLLLNVAAPGLTQTFPSWGNHEPSGGTGNIVPPNGQEFVRQDPMPEDMEDITIFASNKDGIKLRVEFPDVFDYELTASPDNTEYRRYKANSGFKVTGEIGEPEILNRVFYLQVPRDASNIKISSTNQQLKGDKKENIELYPIPEIVFEEDPEGFIGSEEVFTINKDFYEKDQFFPEAQAQITEDAFKHDLHLIRVSIPVMLYNPKATTIQEIKAVELKISYESQLDENSIAINFKRDPFHKVFNAIVPNYTYRNIKPPMGSNLEGGVVELTKEDLTNPSWASQNHFYPDYLVIVARDTFSVALNNWADHRIDEAGGQHNIAIAYLSDIKDAYPSQNLVEEKIKAAIEMVYTNWRVLEEVPSLNFLMLIGDADIGGNTAPWFLPTWRSTLEADDTSDNDYVWLIGDDDINDVMMGRLPAKDEEELNTMVTKIINFENNPPQGENHYGTRSLMLYTLGDPYRTLPSSDITRNFLLGQNQEFDEFHNYYLPYYEKFHYDSDTIKTLLNEKGELFVGYEGHGNYNGWAENVNIYDLENNDKLTSVVVSLACQTAFFDYPDSDSFGERWLKHEEGGSVCYFGAARNGVMSFLMQEFFKIIYRNNLTTVGASIDAFRIHLSDPDKKVYNLLGDPATDFSNHLGQSTKTDLKIRDTWHTPESPTSLNEPMTFSSWIENKSDTSVSNIPVQLLSVDSGNFNVLDEWTIPFLPPSSGAVNDFSLSYQAESSRLLVSWIDPANTIDELSEFNNWLNYDAKYFPIHVNPSSTSSIEHGTLENPFKELSSAVEHAMDKDLVGDGYILRNIGPIEIHLAKGAYGEGDLIESKSLILKGTEGAEKTILFDSLHVIGEYLQVEDITFDGSKRLYGPTIESECKPVYHSKSGHHNYFIRNIFKNCNNNYAIKIKRNMNTSYQSVCDFYNNIFHDNFGTVYFLDSGWKQNHLKFYNNTFTNNQHNLYLDSESTQPSELSFGFRNNITWNNGNTTVQVAPDMISVGNNNTDDQTFWDLGWANPQYNFSEDPKFKNPEGNDFTLNPDSPSIDAGNPQPRYNDPDGSRNDQGAFGGPQADMPPIQIINPIHGSTIIANTQEPIPINIQWSAYKLNSSNYVEIEMYHIEYEMAPPDKGSSTPYYIGKKVIDLDNILVSDSGSLAFELIQESPNQTYYLTIRDPFINIGDSDKINFKIMSENQSIHNNR